MTYEVWTVMKIQTALYYIILQNYCTIMTSFYSLESECQRVGENNWLHLQDRNEVADDDGNFSDSSVLMY